MDSRFDQPGSARGKRPHHRKGLKTQLKVPSKYAKIKREKHLSSYSLLIYQIGGENSVLLAGAEELTVQGHSLLTALNVPRRQSTLSHLQGPGWHTPVNILIWAELITPLFHLTCISVSNAYFPMQTASIMYSAVHNNFHFSCEVIEISYVSGSSSIFHLFLSWISVSQISVICRANRWWVLLSTRFLEGRYSCDRGGISCI